MVTIADNIVIGPEGNIKFYKGSLGEYIHNIMKDLPPDDVTQINAQTGEEMTNSQFLRFAESIAIGLQSMGAKRGQVMSILGENSMKLSAAALAGIFSSVIIAPLDETLKQFELTNMFNIHRPEYVFCNHKQANDIFESLKSLGLTAKIILLDKCETHDDRFLPFKAVVGSRSGPFIPQGVDDPTKEIAMVLPSSGSTGLPKGVSLSHHAFTYLLEKEFNLCKGVMNERSLQLSHLYWVTGVWLLLQSCKGGGRVFLENEDDELILKAARKYKPSWTFLGPTMLGSLLSHPLYQEGDLDSIKMIISGGAPLSEHVKKLIKVKLPFVNYANAYGMTEMGGAVTDYYPTDDVTCVGIVTNDIQIKIADITTQKTLPIGEIGEICLKNKTLMVGYFRNEEATKMAFDSDGWLRTGDLGYVNEQGLLFIKGRVKQLIKYKHHQISPEEIENCISTFPGVSDVGVVGIPHPLDDHHAMALVVKNADANITEKDIVNYVKENLSQTNQLHDGVKFVESIPRTPVRKIRRIELHSLALSLINQ